MTLTSFVLSILIVALVIGFAFLPPADERTERKFTRFLATARGRTAVLVGADVCRFRWDDYEYQVASRYIEVGGASDKKRFGFNPHARDSGPFERSVALLKQVQQEGP